MTAKYDNYEDLNLNSTNEENEEHSSTSEEEDEEGKEWTEEIEKSFLKTLSCLKSKDPKIYDESVKFFNDNMQLKLGDKSMTTKKRVKDEPTFLRDYERKLILEKKGILSDEDSDENYSTAKNRANSPTYVQEQKQLKENFNKFLRSNDSESEDENFAGFLKVKVKNEEEKAKEDEDYIEWLKGQRTELDNKQTEGDLKYLHDYWTNPELNTGEQFLRDYILNKSYLEKVESRESEMSFSEEEKILDECDEYERKYNFRFEEPGAEFINTYPRTIENSLRRKDEKRKRKREERKKRREEELERKKLEVKQLQKKKKQELLERIEKLKAFTGNKELAFAHEEFCADEYDKTMNQLFNDEFYEKDDDCDKKPQFSDLDMDNDDMHIEGEETGETELDGKPYNDDNIDSDFIMDCDYHPEQERQTKFKKQTRSSRRKGHKKSTFSEAIKGQKPLFDPNDKSFQQYLDEYYGLEFEDIIDDMPCRFKYRKVVPNDFGLSIEEILAADDKELNKWCSMQKVDTIRPEKIEAFDRKVYGKKGQNIELKKKIFPSLFAEDEVVEENTSSYELTNNQKKKKKTKYRKSKYNPELLQQCQELNENSSSLGEKIKSRKRNADSSTAENSNKRLKMSMKMQTSNKKSKSQSFTKKHENVQFSNNRKKAFNNNIVNNQLEVSDARLKAYGINPKKFKNKMKYASHD